MVRLVSGLALVLAACATPAPSPCPEITPASSSGNDQGASRAPDPAPPAGFVTATVEAVAPSPEGHTLLLADPGRARVVPILIGQAEAMTIDLRLRGETFERPLTHDLLDAILRVLGGSVVMVQVDKLRTGVFVGSVFVWDGSATHRIDARTSDAIAIAVGHHVPIYVAPSVFEEAGIPAGEIR